MRNKFYYLVLVAGIGLITFSMVRKQSQNTDVLGANKDDVKKQEDVTVKENFPGKSYLEGVLYKSEEPRRGNLKLLSNDGDIYLRTSRDFSALLGLQVLVIVNGTKDNFELVDIQSKVAKDGFLLNQ